MAHTLKGCAKNALSNCPYCDSAPVRQLKPPSKCSYIVLGPMAKVMCPKGCLSTRLHCHGKDVAHWNQRVITVANTLYKIERGERIKSGRG